MTLAAVSPSADPWRWEPHPEVWVLIAGLAALWWFAVRRVGPRAARPGETIVTRSNIAWFVLALLTLWIASDWPVHDIAEDYLFSVHMSQHLLLSLILPPMVWMATPTWLARLAIGSGRAYRVVRAMSRFVPASLLFNGVVAFTHWPLIVNTSADNGPFHYGIHVLVVGSALVMWLPVCGPLPELRFSLTMQMPYLFVQSIIPTLPSAWLIFAEGVVYEAYDIPYRLWSVSLADDQQMAGLLMKIGAGAFLWTLITILFFRWASRGMEDDRYTGVTLDRRAPALTWDDVQRELERAGPAPHEPP